MNLGGSLGVFHKLIQNSLPARIAQPDKSFRGWNQQGKIIAAERLTNCLNHKRENTGIIFPNRTEQSQSISPYLGIVAFRGVAQSEIDCAFVTVRAEA